MNFKYVDNITNLYKDNHYLKNRDLSILEFQMRIFDLVFLSETPFMERLNFIKIICSNLEEFISVRLPDSDKYEIPKLIHTIEAIYERLGDFLDRINIMNHVSLNTGFGPMYKIVKDKSFQYIYAGEANKDMVREMKEVIRAKKEIGSIILLHANCSKSFIKRLSPLYEINVPVSMLLIDEYIEVYKSKCNKNDYYKKEISKVDTIEYYNEIRKKDMLIRTPYESYDHVLEFIDQMCTHPNIIAIFITLYRTAKDSKIIKSLLSAKASGKEVYVYIEPTARDNEEENLQNIRALTNVGIHVNGNYYNYKVHSKLFCAVDKNGKVFSHIGTGNYNEKTSKLYTDFHLLTSDESITQEALHIMMSIFRKDIYRTTKRHSKLYSSPLNLRSTIIRLIDNEIKKGENGEIRIKCNNLCDYAIINKLYEAASHRVKVQIICRTGCSMTIKDNIEIRSKVGRYLEHDRFYIFGKNDDCVAYISSADLLLRNINKRLEVMCEITDTDNKEKIITTFDEIWNNKRIHILQDDGRWRMG